MTARSQRATTKFDCALCRTKLKAVFPSGWSQTLSHVSDRMPIISGIWCIASTFLTCIDD